MLIDGREIRVSCTVKSSLLNIYMVVVWPTIFCLFFIEHLEKLHPHCNEEGNIYVGKHTHRYGKSEAVSTNIFYPQNIHLIKNSARWKPMGVFV